MGDQKSLKRSVLVLGLFLVFVGGSPLEALGKERQGTLALDTLEDGDLKSALHEILERKHERVLSYSEARNLVIGNLHIEHGQEGPFIRDVYCWEKCPLKGGPKLGALNVEHTWPQSRFASGESKAAQKSDLHHLFPSDRKMNAYRGNFKFGEVKGHSKDLNCDESRLGHGPSGIRFEPPDEHKGNVARALFYFSVRYNISIDRDEEEALRSWNRFDPVDDLERERNEKIAQKQGNRNVFVDHPEYVDRIRNF